MPKWIFHVHQQKINKCEKFIQKGGGNTDDTTGEIQSFVENGTRRIDDLQLKYHELGSRNISPRLDHSNKHGLVNLTEY